MRRRFGLVVAGSLLAVGALAGCTGERPEVSLPTAPPEGVSGSPGVSLPDVSRSPSRSPGESAPPDQGSPTAEESRSPIVSSSAEDTATAQPTKTLSSAPASPSASQKPTSASPTKSTESAPASPTSQSPSDSTESADATGTASATDSADATESASTEPSATESSATESNATASPSESSPSEEASTATAASPTPSAGAGDQAATNDPMWWLWFAAAAVVVGGLLWFLTNRSRRRQWDERLEVERVQAVWVLDELTPIVTSAGGQPEVQAAHWAGARTTLDQLEAGLAALVAEAPDEGRGQSAQTLAAATAEVRQAVEADLAVRSGNAGTPADAAALAASAVRVQSARDQFAAAIATAAPGSTGG